MLRYTFAPFNFPNHYEPEKKEVVPPPVVKMKSFKKFQKTIKDHVSKAKSSKNNILHKFSCIGGMTNNKKEESPRRKLMPEESEQSSFDQNDAFYQDAGGLNIDQDFIDYGEI